MIVKAGGLYFSTFKLQNFIQCGDGLRRAVAGDGDGGRLLGKGYGLLPLEASSRAYSTLPPEASAPRKKPVKVSPAPVVSRVFTG